MMTDWNKSDMWLQLLFLLVLLLHQSIGTHFRGGIIMWKPTGIQNQVVINFRISWRKSFGGTQCNSDTIAAGTYIGPSGENMKCLSVCSGTITSMDYKCTDFSDGEDWSAGEKSYTYTFPDSADHYYQFGFTGGDWIALVTGGGSWEMRTTVNLTTRSDTGTVNSSPVSAMQPIVRIQHGCNATIEIPVSDDDGDEVRCRWAEAAKRECADVCQTFTGSVLDERSCKISYSATGRPGWYAAAVQIEDFARATDTEPLSSVPLQFLVLVFTSDSPCSSKPEFVEPTRVDTSCVGVPYNTTFFEPLIARSGDETISIVEINTVSPVGVTKSDLAPYRGSSREWHVNITWSPTEEQEGSNIFCFSATDSAGLTSEQSCITLLGGVTPPEIVNGSQSPVGDILPTHSAWSINFDTPFVQPTRPTYVYFYKTDGTLAHKVDVATVTGYPQGSLSRTITFDPKFTFTEKEYYYLLLDPGVARGTTYCGAESSAIRDPSFWNVRIRDITPPRLQYLQNPDVTNANVTLSWSFDEEVTTKCTIQTPTSVSVVPCNSTWTGTDLSEGYYTIYIQGTDRENNAAVPVRHTWRVDRTAPILSLYSTPEVHSNRTSFTFKFRCNEVCTTQCKLYQKGTQESFTSCAGGSSRYTKSFSTGTLSTNIQYVFEVKPTDVVGNHGDVQTFEWQTDFVAPVIPSMNVETVACGDDYSPNVTGIPAVTDNLDVDPVVKYGDQASGECGIIRVWNATDNAGNTAYTSQEIKFTSPRQPSVQFPDDATVPCGDLEQVTKTLMLPAVMVDHPCRLPVNISYADPNEAGRCGLIFNRLWSVTDDCGGQVSHSQRIQVLELQVPDTPQNGQTNIDLQYTLRWPVYPGSVSYKVFLWNADERKPTGPVAVTTEPEYTIAVPLRPGTQFLWQVEFLLNNNESLPSPQWGFETRKYPDVTVESIIVPPVAYSGQTFDVRWTVRNIGNLTTQAYRWSDAVFISFTEDFSRARRASVVQLNNILFPNDGYTAEATVELKDKDIGQLYVFVQTDIYRQISDIDTSNNLRKSDDIIDAKLTPPPDLRVDTVIVPSSSYSGNDISITFTVKNYGTGVTAVNSWYDQILWSNDAFFNSSDTKLARLQRNGGLIQDETYTVQTKVVVPREIFGDFYIIVQADVYNQVFEHTAEDNNIGVSNAINVILSPPPDLRVVSLQMEDSFSTGDDMHVKWQVDNDGDAPYKQTWFDRVVLRSLDGIVTEVLHTATFSGTLLYEESYTRSFTYIVSPSLPAGQYNLTLHVDYRGEIFEFNKKENNVKSKVISVYQALPDLAVEDLSTIVSSSESGNTINVTWIVRNNGPGRTVETAWRDAVYIRPESGNVLVYDWNVALDRSLQVNDTYELTYSVRLPLTVYGNVLVSVNVDKSGRTADRSRSNNIRQASVVNIPLRSHDFELLKIERLGNGEIYSGSTITIKWEVLNSGVNITQDSVWEEQIILSPSSSSLVPVLASVEARRGGPLDNGLIYINNSSFKIPDSVVGDAFLHVLIDPNNKVFEGPNIINNEKSIALSIQNPPSPDFLVTRINASLSSATSISRKVLVISWTVVNIGNSMKFKRQWMDAVYLGTSVEMVPTEANKQLYLLDSFVVDAALETQQSYKMVKSILLPQNLIGKYFVYVFTDSRNSISEVNAEENNFDYLRSVIEIKPPPTSELSVTVESVGTDSSKSLRSGMETRIQFVIRNTGEIATSRTSWNDVIYLMNIGNADKRTVLQNGKKVATLGHVGILSPSEMYTVNVSIIIPFDFFGEAYFYVFADLERESDEASSVGTFATSPKFRVVKGNFPNLYPSMDTMISEHHGGEPYVLAYNVTNKGEYTAAGKRYDAVYLSDDIILDPFDRRLQTNIILTSLEVNKTITSSLSVFLPFDLESKTYFLILVVDIRNEIYESNENDNTAKLALTILERVSTDIAVTAVEAPKSVSFGNDMEVNWKIRNNGKQRAKGYKCDTAYISDDNEWDITDEQIGNTVCGYITINPYSSSADDKSSSMLFAVPLLAEGSYSAIVKTRSNILDNYLENNIGIANSTTTISIEHIVVDSTLSLTFNPEDEKAFRIPDVPADETLIVSVTGSNQDNFNEVRMRFNKPATKYDFDMATSDPFLSNQIIVLPNTRYGDYYMLIDYSGSVSSNPSASQLTVEVRLAKFEILKTNPAKASPLGNVTVTFEGTLLPEDVTAKLSHVNRDIYAIEVFRFSSTLVYATFDMKESAPGETYSASLFSEYLNLTTSMPDVLSVVEGIPGRAKASLSLPAALRPGERGFVYVDIQNEGDTDILAPIVAVTTNAIGHLKFITNLKTTDYLQRYVMVASPSQGPGGILPPKGYSRLIFDAKQIDPDVIGRVQVSVTVIEPDKTKEHDYIKQKTKLKFSHYENDAWDKIWDNFIGYAGTTWWSLNMKVSEISNQMSVAGRRVHELSDFVIFLLDMSDSPKGDNFVTKTTDIFLESNDSPHVGLEIKRQVSPKIGLRYSKGSFGKGWISSFWDTKLEAISPEIARLQFDKIDFLFTTSGFGSYENSALGRMVIRNSGCYYIDKKSEREYRYNSTTGVLLSVSSDRDGSFTNLQYGEHGRVQKIIHSSGAYVDITYDEMDRISSAYLRNSTIVGEQIAVYSYDPMENLLVAAEIDGQTTRYEYSPQGFLSAVTYPGGRREEFQYTSKGHLKSRAIIERKENVAEIKYTYDGRAQVTRTLHPDDISVTYTYNELGNVASAHRKGGPKEKFITTMNTRSIYEGDAIVIYERYDRMENAVHLEDGNGDSLEIKYDRLGQVNVLKDGGGNMYRVDRNRNGTLRRSVFPDNTEENYIYRTDGHDVVTRNGVTKHFNYDNDGRVVWKDIGADDVTTYQYDDSGNMIAVSNKIGTVSFSYDKESLLQSVQYPDGVSLNYGFTEKGLKSSINSSIGYNVKYVYNDRGLLTEARDLETGTVLVQAEYFSSGKLKIKRLGNGAYTKYSYQQESGLLKSQYNYYANDTLSSKFEYGYDTRERRITLRTLEGEWKFRYDTSGQVTHIKRPNGHETGYSYDERKNRKSVTYNGITKLYKVNSMNQYTDFDDDQSFTHDQNGNLIEVRGSKSRQYKFDEENKLVEVQTPDAKCVFLYDGIDSLHKKQCQDETTQYLVDPFGKNGPDILAEIHSLREKAYYYHGGDQLGLVAMKTGDEFYYYQFDPLGSVVSLLGKDGTLLNSYKYEPFGEIISSVENINNPFKYVGQLGVMGFKEAPELHYMRARFYDAQHGRFLSADPLGIAGKSKNFYTYAYNNPIHFNDPKGTIAPWVVLGVVNTAVYAGFQFATGGDITLGGAASAFVTGAIGGAAATRITQLTAGIGSKAASYYTSLNLGAKVNILNSMVGALTEHIGNNIFSDTPFDGEKLGASILNGVLQTFVPGGFSDAVKSALGNVGGFLLDPSKSAAEKWEHIKKTWKNRYDVAKDVFDKGLEMVKDAWSKVKNTAQEKWGDFKDYVDDLSDKVGDKWQDLKEDLRYRLDDVKDTLKDTWEDVKERVSDQWDNIKDEVKKKWEDIKDDIDKNWENLKDEVSESWEDLKDTARDQFEDFKDKLSEKWQDVKDTISDKVDEAMRDLSDAYDKLKDKMKDFGDDLKNEFDDLVDDAEKAWDDFKDDMGDLADGIMDWIRSRDPNDIIGPVGYGAARFVAKSTRLNYKIRFENDPNATAPAQRVFIEHSFDPDLNPRAFRVGTFGFGNYTHELEMDRSYLQMSINLTEEFGIFLRVRGGLDIVNGRALWDFQSIDPDTGSPPADPRIGFLPPNNGTTGQGFVTFSITPRKDAPSLARIDATATIYFDQNEPIETPPIFNTIDDSAPSVNASVLNDTIFSGSLALALDTYDIGAGLKEVDILLKEGAGYNLLMPSVNESAVTLPLSPGGTYDLVFSPVDYVGNRQDLEESVQTSFLQVFFPHIELTCTGVKNCSGHGNCTGPDICICEAGFYRDDCSTNTPPVEPPILELMSPGGYEDEVIQLYALAKLFDGTSPENLFIELEGFPTGTTFSKGHLEDSILTVQSRDFGNIDTTFPDDFAANVSLSARAIYMGGNINVSRSGNIKIVVTPVFDHFSLSAIAGCYDDASYFGGIPINVTAAVGDKDQSETMAITVELPRSYTLGQGQRVSDGIYMYSFNQTEIQSSMTVMMPSNHTFVPFNIKIMATVTEKLQPGLSVTKAVETMVKHCSDISSTKSSVTKATDTTDMPLSSSTESEPGIIDGETSRQTVAIIVGSIVGVIGAIAVVVLVVKICMARKAGGGHVPLGSDGYHLDNL